MKKDYTVLYNLLIECCRHEPDTTLLEIHASKIDNWDGFLNSAYVHGVFPLVHRSLKSVNTVPDEIKSKLKSINFKIASRNLTMTAELLKIMKLLEENNILALAIKGPVLSQIIYGDVTQRQYADLDILVHSDDVWRAGVILSENTYLSEQPLKFLKNKTLLKVDKDMVFTNEKQNIFIELHWRLFSGKILEKGNLKLFHKNPITCTINQQLLPTIQKDVLLLYLLVHGSKHLWERLEWITDIDRIIRLSSKIDWNYIVKTAKIMEIEALFYLGLAMSESILGTQIPEHLSTHCKNDLRLQKAMKIMSERISDDSIINEKQKYLTCLSDYALKKKENYLVYYWKQYIQINKKEVYLINLPYILSPLYWFFVVLRELKNIGTKIYSFFRNK